MTRVILDVPTDKMQSFLQAILRLGLDSHSISSRQFQQQFSARDKRRRKHLRAIGSSYLLFDWEFFSNELEYE